MNSRKTIRYTMEDVAPAVAMLQKGGLVALPTETVVRPGRERGEQRRGVGSL